MWMPRRQRRWGEPEKRETRHRHEDKSSKGGDFHQQTRLGTKGPPGPRMSPGTARYWRWQGHPVTQQPEAPRVPAGSKYIYLFSLQTAALSPGRPPLPPKDSTLPSILILLLCPPRFSSTAPPCAQRAPGLSLRTLASLSVPSPCPGREVAPG